MKYILQVKKVIKTKPTCSSTMYEEGFSVEELQSQQTANNCQLDLYSGSLRTLVHKTI